MTPVIHHLCHHFNIPEADLYTPLKVTHKAGDAKKLLIKYMNAKGYKYKVIKATLKFKNESSVTWNLRKANNYITTDPNFRQVWERIKEM